MDLNLSLGIFHPSNIFELAKALVSQNILIKTFPLETSHICNGLKSYNDEHSKNIAEKLVPLETFHLCKGFKSDKDLHLLNIPEKLVHLEIFQFYKEDISDKDEQ